MIYEEFGYLVSEICSHSPLAAGRPLVWTIIANPKAGGFTIKSRWKKHLQMLQACAQKAGKNPLREGNPSKTSLSQEGNSSGNGLMLTRSAGHAADITRMLLEEAALDAGKTDTGNPGSDASKGRPFYIIISAGGDGTSLEIMTSLYNAPSETRENFAILRLPMGTGNDGADAWDLDKALLLLMERTELHKQRALRLTTASGKGPFLAFNILSVGLDAFVTHMTNKMKGKLPGDSYKLWVDVASLLYDRLYKVDYMDVRAKDSGGNEVKSLNEKLLLLAVGESGRRSYGSHQWILPDERNVCAIKQMPLFLKLALKGSLAYGTHIDRSEAILWNASSVEFTARHPMLAQMDGEAVLLDDKDYPAVIELTEPVIPVLKLSPA